MRVPADLPTKAKAFAPDGFDELGRFRIFAERGPRLADRLAEGGIRHVHPLPGAGDELFLSDQAIATLEQENDGFEDAGLHVDQGPPPPQLEALFVELKAPKPNGHPVELSARA